MADAGEQQQPQPQPQRRAARLPLGDLLALLAGAGGRVIVQHEVQRGADGDGDGDGDGGGEAGVNAQSPEGMVEHLRRSGVLTR